MSAPNLSAPDPSASSLGAALIATGYLPSPALGTALRLVTLLGKPLLLEGPAGVGKTQAAKALAEALGTRLIRLQCYEGLDAQSALYEWNYPRQLLHLRLLEGQHALETNPEAEQDLYRPEFLLRRPLLEAITQDAPPVLLIDEVDRADEAFEAFLLELLAEWQISIPELGTISATHRPHVILTSNRERDLSDALRRRCLYLWVDYPTPEAELAIVRARLPDVEASLAQQVVNAAAYLRALPLSKTPGIAETLDWVEALVALHRDALTPDTVEETLGCVIKLREDQAVVRQKLQGLMTAALQQL
ncbi:MoxR family ATPase [Deinococcus detaillensis]|uniref:MoxR family ATPase n=1 Tax=Deinococcus detaillensis TaxID=2592048 RepID=A0A553UQU7_9DEIO|nr:MoxR family ATPase [Deinococcus detaillensis]TSA82562.1 MoxR family ATPase [Deinococcus detaillensis]